MPFWDRVKSLFGATPTLTPLQAKVAALVDAKLKANEPFRNADIATGFLPGSSYADVVRAIDALLPTIEAAGWQRRDLTGVYVERVFCPAGFDVDAWLASVDVVAPLNEPTTLLGAAPYVRQPAPLEALTALPVDEIKVDAASNPELEAAIAADPSAVEPYLVYADWLQSHGDPRGELIMLQHAGGDGEDLIAKHPRHFLGNLPSHVTFEWRLGFLRSARVFFDEDDGHTLRVMVAELLSLPSARFLEELTLGLAEGHLDGENDYGDVIELLAEKPRPSLRTLFIGDFMLPDETEMSWSHIGDAEPLWAALPSLRSVILSSGTMDLGSIVVPELRSLDIRTGGLTLANIHSLCTATCPQLERLSIWFGDVNYGAQGGVDDIAAILDGKLFPNLRHLGLKNADFTDELCRLLPTAKILPQLTSLDLAMGIMSDEGARTLAQHHAAFAHLTKLDVSDNYLSQEGVAALGVFGARVECGAQRQIYAEDRYVSVGE